MSLVAMSVMCFTFQSGSIQIVRLYPLNLERIPLHSNLVLFKLYPTKWTGFIKFHFTFQSGSIQIPFFASLA